MRRTVRDVGPVRRLVLDGRGARTSASVKLATPVPRRTRPRTAGAPGASEKTTTREGHEDEEARPTRVASDGDDDGEQRDRGERCPRSPNVRRRRIYHRADVADAGHVAVGLRRRGERGDGRGEREKDTVRPPGSWVRPDCGPGPRFVAPMFAHPASDGCAGPTDGGKMWCTGRLPIRGSLRSIGRSTGPSPSWLFPGPPPWSAPSFAGALRAPRRGDPRPRPCGARPVGPPQRAPSSTKPPTTVTLVFGEGLVASQELVQAHRAGRRHRRDRRRQRTATRR